MIQFDELVTKYGNFLHPVAVITINGKDIDEKGSGLGVSNITVENTSGYEASMATFHIYNCFDPKKRQFQQEKLKDFIYIGYSVKIEVGYQPSVREVFVGFISQVDFLYTNDGLPNVMITAMDFKGIMMSNNYSKQITADYYSDAVKKIFEGSVYQKLQSEKIITALSIAATPDKPGGDAGAAGTGGAGGAAAAPPGGAGGAAGGQTKEKTIEMVAESDYEFVVRAAKKYNYEFFSSAGSVIFRKAKSDNEVLMEIGSDSGIRSFDVSYDITGLVGSIEVRSMDPGKATQISSTVKFNNKISQGSKAKSLITGQKKVYVDPTVFSKEDATHRGNYLMEDMSFRYGTLECTMVGLPEIEAGKFIQLKDMGTSVSNKFYITDVRHIMDGDLGFFTKITGKAASLQDESAAGGANGPV